MKLFHRDYSVIGLILILLCFFTAAAAFACYHFYPNPVNEVYTEEVAGSFESFNAPRGWIRLKDNPLSFMVGGVNSKYFRAAAFVRQEKAGAPLRMVVKRQDLYQPRVPPISPHVKMVTVYAVASDKNLYLSLTDSHKAYKAEKKWALFCAILFAGFGCLLLYATGTEGKPLMNTTPFKSISTGFDVLDLTARYEFKTASSIGFGLFNLSADQRTLTEVGKINVHYPCDGHIKTRLFVSVPERHHQHEHLKEIVDRTFAALQIPADETFEADFTAPGQCIKIIHHIDRKGNHGGIHLNTDKPDEDA
ncbi:MAG: hypothetical protein K8I00_08090 [Candidatus Omnitrophica bacterium]|nr:hypothetical protein [Candidatus Omnitrophota bacterium]